MKAIEQHFPVVLFIMLFPFGLTFESMDEILRILLLGLIIEPHGRVPEGRVLST